MPWTNLCFKTISDRLRFSPVRDDTQDMARLENLADRHRDGSARNFFETAKPSFADLLKPASLIEFDDQIRLFGFKVGRGIIEREVAVFSDADECCINRVSRDDLSQTAGFGQRV